MEKQRIRRLRTKLVFTTCERCGIEFKVSTYVLGQKKYCGKKCQVGTLEQKFWSHVNKIEDDTSCWEWTASFDDHGYGVMGIEGKTPKAHRVSYELHNGVFDYSLFVCHKCDNPHCVRPDHLFLGTASDNMKDCAAKGRNSGLPRIFRGEEHGGSKLTEDMVRNIRILHSNGMMQKDIAATLNLSKHCIWSVVNRISWKHVN